jgi:PAS domain S-box-containing protein
MKDKKKAKGQPAGKPGIRGKDIGKIPGQASPVLTTVLDNMSELVAYQDTDNRVLWVNRAAADSVNLTPEQLVGRFCYEIWHQRNQPCEGCPVIKARETGQMQQSEITSPDGTVWLVRGDPVKDVNGNITGLIEVTQDITQRKRAEDALKQSEERYRTVLEDMEEAYYEEDLAGNFTFFNDETCRQLGYSREELMGMNYRSYVSPERVKEAFEIFNRIYRTGDTMKMFDVQEIRKDGTPIFVESSASPLRNEKGEIIGFRGVARDVTQRLRMEEALRRSEERYRTLMDEMEEPYYEVDLAGNYTFFNDALCKKLGYSREEMKRINYKVYTVPDDVKKVFEYYNQVYRTGVPVKWFPSEQIKKDGARLLTETSVFPLQNKEGKIVGFRGVSRDVTEHKRTEEERKQLELKAQITSRLASVGEMAAGVAHEINNPLTAVTGYAQLLIAREDIPPDIKTDLLAINDGAQRVAGIVQRLLTFSRQTKPQRKLVDINELIESTLILRAYQLKVNNIKVTTRLAPDLLETVVDPGQTQQVLLNLIVNAETEMKLAHGKGKLTITTEKSDNTIKICVKDDGPGIKPEIMDRIFDPFFTTREAGQGTGLGLSLCYGIVTEHKGKIYVKSQPGKGATFIVELPVVTEAAPPKPAQPDAKKSKKVVKARILVVDDEQVVRDVVNRVLTGEGHKVETVDKAADALKEIESKKYNLILLDIKMPGISGVTLYKRIQKIDRSLAERVVFITGDIMGADTEKFLSEAKVAHIDKPFDAERLIREVQRALTGGR